MRKTKIEKGITLIALTITIVLLLIVVAVAVYSIKEYGILGKSEDKLKDYNESVENEKNNMKEYDNIFGEKVEYLVQLYLDGKLKIGDYVNYKPSKNEVGYKASTRGKIPVNEYVDVNQTVKSGVIEQEELNWRVFGYNKNDGTLLLISSTPTKKEVEFNLNGNTVRGWDTMLNDICSTLYSNTNIKGAEARNFKYLLDFRGYDDNHRNSRYYNETNYELQNEMATGGNLKYCYASADSSFGGTKEWVTIVDGNDDEVGFDVVAYNRSNKTDGGELKVCLRPVVIIDNTVTTKEVPIAKTNPFEKWTAPADQFYSKYEEK